MTDPKEITVPIELTIRYKAIMNGDNVIVLDACFRDNYYPITSLPEAARETILNAICNEVRAADRQAHDDLAEFDRLTTDDMNQAAIDRFFPPRSKE